MIKNLSLAVLSALILSCFTPAFAFDHQTIKQRVQRGEITKQQAKHITKNNNHYRKLSKKEMKAHAKQRQKFNNRNHNKFNFSNNKDHNKFSYYNNRNHNKFNYNNDFNTPNFNHRHHNNKNSYSF